MKTLENSCGKEELRSTVMEFAGSTTKIEVDGMDQIRWSKICQDFQDANFYQSWAYETARSGEANVSHLIIKRNGLVVAAVQARLVRIPLLGSGLAYIVWGPLWRTNEGVVDVEVFRETLRAIKAEYVFMRKLGVRIAPRIDDSDKESFLEVLRQEGFIHQEHAKKYHTVILDLQPSLDELLAGLHQKWRYHLKKARKQNLEIISGEEDELFEGFESIYHQMVDRKGLEDVTDMRTLRSIQKKLLPDEKMKVILCKVDGEICAGGICSTIGATGIYLYGATSNRGISTYSSYLVHWNMLEWVKQRGCRWYDLNGINPLKNPGGYQFKTQFAGANGKEVHFLGQFDCYPNSATKLLIACGEGFRSKLKAARKMLSRRGAGKKADKE
jgi:lipid II:glycine glycyltransferase (peptidoglycan interpeptide bridge formation enzyme)